METHESIDYYRQKISERFRKNVPLLVTGVFVITCFLLYSVVAVYKNNYNIFSSKNDAKSIEVNKKSEEIEQMIKSKKININAPTPQSITGESLSQLDESPTLEPTEKVIGQISAISSGQVTYAGTTYVVQEGDTLGIIANKVYGDADAWMTIADANGIWDPSSLYVGMELTIPR